MPNAITPWISKVRPTKDGEQVRASVANRYPSELDQRTIHLKQRLDALTAGEALFAREVAISTEVKIGHAVYWNSTAQEYQPALAKVDYDPGLSVYTLAESAYAVGICSFKYNATRADICLFGFIREFDFTEGIGTDGSTPAEGGAYYLSASVAGRYSQQKPAIGIFIAFLRGDSSAHINPTPRELLEAHVHYALDLFAEPCGLLDCPVAGEVYTFNEVDLGVPGWAPTEPIILLGDVALTNFIAMTDTTGVVEGQFVFGSGIPDGTKVTGIVPNTSITISEVATIAALAVSLTFQNFAVFPAGAKLGYNLPLHPELERLWPPIPVGSTYLELDGRGVPGTRYVADINGLWWFEDCYDKAPWPIEMRPCWDGAFIVPPDAPPVFVPPLCDAGPTLEQQGFFYNAPSGRALRFYFTKMIFKTNNALVTSLRPATGSPIQVLDCDGNPATTGDLELALDLGLNIIENDHRAYALKHVSGTEFRRGPVVTGLRAGANIQFSLVGIDPAKSFQDGGIEEVPGGTYHGEVVITAQVDPLLNNGQAELVALNGALEDQESDIFFLALPENRNTSFRLRLGLPPEGVPPTSELVMWFLVMARTNAVALPKLKLKYRILPKPAALCTLVALPTTDTVMADLDPSVCGSMDLNEYTEVEADGIPVTDGDTVYLTVERIDDGVGADGYPADVGILRMGFRLETP